MPEKRKRKKEPVNVDPRALIARLNREAEQLREQEIIAPLLVGGRIRTRLRGLVYEFKVRQRFTGWGRFQPVSESEAEVRGEVLPWERGAYLELFPLLRVVLLWPDRSGRSPGTWLALPYNESDAYQRFGLSYEPLPVFLCDPTAGADRFERVLVRVDGRTLWFDGPDVLTDPTHAEWLRTAASEEVSKDFPAGLASSERQALLYWHIHNLELEQVVTAAHLAAQMPPQTLHEQRTWLRQQEHRLKMEENLRRALAKADATFHSYSEIVGSDGSTHQLVVEWSERGQTYHYRSSIDPELAVISSGICLSGRDRDFDLTSLVNVISTSPDWSQY